MKVRYAIALFGWIVALLHFTATMPANGQTTLGQAVTQFLPH